MQICLWARKVILPGLLRNGPPGLLTMQLTIMTEVLRTLFVLKFIASLFFFFFSSTELHEVNNNYDTNLLKQTYQLLGMARYHISWSLRQISMAVAPGEKSYFLFAKRRATVLPIYFHFLWATDVTNIIGMRTN